MNDALLAMRTVGMQDTRRIAIIDDGSAQASQRACLAGVAAAFAEAARLCEIPVQLVLAVASPEAETGKADEGGMPVRAWVWEALDEQACRRVLFYDGHHDAATSLPTAGTHVVADDGIRHLCDCHAWIFSRLRSPAPVLPLRPFLVMADDDLHHASGGLTAEELRVVGSNLAAAVGVLVWSDEMQREVIDFYGVAAERVRLLPRPRACCVDEPVAAASDVAEAGFVWFVPDVVTAAAGPRTAAGRGDAAGQHHPLPPEMLDDPSVAHAYGEALAELL